MTRFALATAPATEPVTKEEAKAHARIEHDAEDALIEGFIRAARRKAEHDTGRAFVSQTWTATLDRLPAVEQTTSPVVTAVEGFRRIALSPNPATITSLVIDGTTIESTLYALRGNEIWIDAGVLDSTATLGGGIVITFTAAMPAFNVGDLELVKLAIKMNVSYWFENRESVRTDGGYPAVVANGYDALIAPLIHLAI